eukprot:gene15014-22918_t
MSGHIEVIGAGLCRTGTNSLREALNELGYTTYHMYENLKNNHTIRWIDAYKKREAGEKLTMADFPLEDFTAGVDHPFCDFYVELMALNPDAKVILSVRDTPQKWVESFKATVGAAMYSWVDYAVHVTFFAQSVSRPRAFIRYCYNSFIFDKDKTLRFPLKDPEDDGKMAALYEGRVKEVMAKVPKNRLLVFNAKQGWKPLCEFLGKPVPDHPFPNTNDTKALNAVFASTRRMLFSA